MHIQCAQAQFHEKTDIFRGLCKKDKKHVMKRLILVLNFVIFT
jgi:hypothetical protein